MTDQRPTQDEVEAKAAEMFGDGWKAMPERAKAGWDRWVVTKLDQARAVVMRER